MDSNTFSIFDFRLPIKRRPLMDSQDRQSKIGNWQSAMSLSLRELEALARALLTVLLAFLNARIAGHQARLLQGRPQVGVVQHQSPRNAVANRTGLARGAAARHIDQNVKLVAGLSQIKRLANNQD